MERKNSFKKSSSFLARGYPVATALTFLSQNKLLSFIILNGICKFKRKDKVFLHSAIYCVNHFDFL